MNCVVTKRRCKVGTNVCIQCALEATAEGRPLSDAFFTESVEEHAKKHAGVTPEQRAEWERKVEERLKQEGKLP